MRTLFFVGLLAAAPAFATGERVLLTGATHSLRETICVSMSCISSGDRDAIVSGRLVRGGLEITVKTGAGLLKLVHVLPVEDGKPSSIELIRATSLVLRAIESPKPLKLKARLWSRATIRPAPRS